jgi:hypothetical protein
MQCFFTPVGTDYFLLRCPTVKQATPASSQREQKLEKAIGGCQSLCHDLQVFQVAGGGTLV